MSSLTAALKRQSKDMRNARKGSSSAPVDPIEVELEEGASSAGSKEKGVASASRIGKKRRVAEEQRRSQEEREHEARSEDVEHGRSVSDVDLPFQSTGARIYVPNWRYTWDDEPYNDNSASADVAMMTPFPRDVAKSLVVPEECAIVRAEADVYRAMASMRGLTRRLELKGERLKQITVERDDLLARNEVLTRERDDSFLKEQAGARRLAETLEQLSLRDARVKELEELVEGYGTSDAPGPLLLEERQRVRDAAVQELCPEVLANWDRGFLKAKRLIGGAYPELDLSAFIPEGSSSDEDEELPDIDTHMPPPSPEGPSAFTPPSSRRLD